MRDFTASEFHGHDSEHIARRTALISLQRRLRKWEGDSLENFPGAEEIGHGIQKKAYLIDGWIVKANTGGWNDGSKILPKKAVYMGFARVKQYTAGRFIIQQPVKVLADCDHSEYNVTEHKVARDLSDNDFDIHKKNCGVINGKLYAFDW